MTVTGSARRCFGRAGLLIVLGLALGTAATAATPREEAAPEGAPPGDLALTILLKGNPGGR